MKMPDQERSFTGMHQPLWATIVGRDTADLPHASTVAIVGGVTLEMLWHTVLSFPTMSEVYVSLLDACSP